MAEKIVTKGVVFHAHEVRATLDDRMTQFRRVVKTRNGNQVVRQTVIDFKVLY